MFEVLNSFVCSHVDISRDTLCIIIHIGASKGQ